MTELPTTHHLLPYERYAAMRTLAAHRAHPDSVALRQKWERWGPEGVVLMAASQIGTGCAVLVQFIAVGCLVGSGGNGAGLVAFYVLLGVAACILLLGVMRSRQRARAAKGFRSGRPSVG